MVLRGVWSRDRGPCLGKIRRRSSGEKEVRGWLGRGERSVEEMKSRPPGTFPAAKGGRATLGTCFRAWAAMRDSLPDEGVVEGQKRGRRPWNFSAAGVTTLTDICYGTRNREGRACLYASGWTVLTLKPSSPQRVHQVYRGLSHETMATPRNNLQDQLRRLKSTSSAALTTAPRPPSSSTSVPSSSRVAQVKQQSSVSADRVTLGSRLNTPDSSARDVNSDGAFRSSAASREDPPRPDRLTIPFVPSLQVPLRLDPPPLQPRKLERQLTA